MNYQNEQVSIFDACLPSHGRKAKIEKDVKVNLLTRGVRELKEAIFAYASAVVLHEK